MYQDENDARRKRKKPLSEANQRSVIVTSKKDGVTIILTSSGNKHTLEIKNGKGTKSRRLTSAEFRRAYITILESAIKSGDMPDITKKENTKDTPKEITPAKEPAVKVKVK